jgi:cytochrome c
MAGMSMGGTQAATQAAATTASSGTAGGAAGSTATATPFVLANVLFGTQSAATTAATGVPPTPAPTTIPPTPALTTTVPAVSAATAAPTTAAGTQAASASGGQGDPKHGQQIFTGVGTCSTCHDVAQGIQIVGPSLKGVATRAATRKPGMSASDYLHESIVNPNAYVVQGFVAGVMPQNFAKTLSAKDIDDLVAYLLTLK